MKKIYKYTLEITDCQTLHLPTRSEVLSVKEQNGSLCVWALIDPMNSNTSPVTIVIYGTGHDTDYEVTQHFRFLDTVITSYNAVWHVYVSE